MRARRQRNLSRHQKIFLQKRVSHKGYPLMGQNQILPRFRGWGLEQFSETKKSSPPGAHLRRAARRYETAARYVSPASSRIAEDDIARFADVVRWSRG
jgi:hypothetical protein